MQNKSKPKTKYPGKNNYSVISKEDMYYERDNEAQLIGQLQEKLEMSREEIKRILQKL